MKKVIFVSLLCGLLLCGCGEAEAEVTSTTEVSDTTLVTTSVTTEAECIVRFDLGDGSEVESQRVARGDKVVEPSTPTKKCGCVFDGWYIGDEKWSFMGYVVTEDMTLTAHWIDCFGLNSKEREIIEGFVDTWGYTWCDIESIERHECSTVNSLGEIVDSKDMNRYTVVFYDGVTRFGCIGREFVEE